MLEKGLKHISRTVVQPDNFALTMGSGDLPVLATPALVALMENAAMLAVAAELPEGATTVGAKMDMIHVRPSGEGEEVHAEATLVEVEGRKLTFSLVARDSADDRRRHAYPLYCRQSEIFVETERLTITSIAARKGI